MKINPFSHFGMSKRLRPWIGPLLIRMRKGGVEADLMMKLGDSPGMNTVL